MIELDLFWKIRELIGRRVPRMKRDEYSFQLGCAMLQHHLNKGKRTLFLMLAHLSDYDVTEFFLPFPQVDRPTPLSLAIMNCEPPLTEDEWVWIVTVFTERNSSNTFFGETQLVMSMALAEAQSPKMEKLSEYMKSMKLKNE